MHIYKPNFYWYERWLNNLGLYELFHKLIDCRLIKLKQRHSSLLKHSTAYLLTKHFDGHQGQQTDARRGQLGFGLLHYSLITLLKSKRVLCIGSRQGFVPAICALACKDQGKGKVDFVDAGKNSSDENNWGGKGFWRKNDGNKHFSLLELDKYIKIYVMTTREFAKKYKRKYDYIYIDGDHSYKGIKRDFRLFWPRLAAGGIMSFHDIGVKGISDEGEEYGVWKLWEELEKKYKFSVIINRDDGVGFIQKHDS